MKLNKKNIILITISLVILIIILITAFDKYEKYKNKTKKLLKVETLYYSLKIDRIKIKSSTYGGIDVLDKKIIYLDNNSGLYSISEEKLDNKKFFNIKSLSAKKIENFKDQFIKSFEDELGDKANALFGVKDILIGDFFSNDRKYLLASSLKFNKSKNCYTLNLFLSEILDKEDLVLSDWSEVYASSPCLKVDLTEPKFAAASAGGRIFKYDNQNVLLTIGDFYSDDVHGPALSQNLKKSIILR